MTIRRPQRSTTIDFTLPDDIPVDDFLDALSSRTPLQIEKPKRIERTFYDSFDWRLFNGGGTLCREHEGRSYRLAWSALGAPAQKVVMHRMKEVPHFAWDFPTGALRSMLAPLLEMRALLPVVELVTTVRVVRLLDSESKTVVRVRIEESVLKSATKEGDNPPGSLPAHVQMEPVRGYEESLERLGGWLGTAGYLGGQSSSLLEDAVAASGAKVGDYSSKLAFHFRPEMRADEAMQEIHRFLLGVMEANCEGVRGDFDSEFLHDFRVAVRRTRSALTQVKGVFDSAQTAYFNQGFAWLGQISGPTRDMHVYLLGFDEYRDALPERFREDINPLRHFLMEHQKSEHAALVEQMASPKFSALLQEWGRFLEEEAVGSGGASGAYPLKKVASRRIAKMFQRVMEEGRAITVNSPPDDLHELRKSCKKLRYLMEFFQSIYPADRVGGLIKELKRLLDNLGDYQDLEVQADKLRDFAHQMVTEGRVPADTLLAMGMLVDGLLRRQQEKREAFYGCFAHFSKNTPLFQTLFSHGKGAGR